MHEEKSQSTTTMVGRGEQQKRSRWVESGLDNFSDFLNRRPRTLTVHTIFGHFSQKQNTTQIIKGTTDNNMAAVANNNSSSSNDKPIMQTTEETFEGIPETIGDAAESFAKAAEHGIEKFEEQWFKEPEEEVKPAAADIKKEDAKLNDILGDMVSMALGKASPEEKAKNEVMEEKVDDANEAEGNAGEKVDQAKETAQEKVDDTKGEEEKKDEEETD